MLLLILLPISLNIYALIQMYWDKRQAKKDAWRVPEKQLLRLGFLGGSLGILAGIYWFRHKTRKRSFLWRAWTALLLHLLLLGFFLYYFYGLEF
ncbi:putative membrane protein [Saprospira grandis DSM 2844]|uniref:Putative membrane protein n=1 Tax=Saprospira grandis DSM 2844 TaxID=694433 RepID=J0NZK0_9BACT|nr:DUF1294 domain-containing protein [Saprospira grandis]EJF52974.1 putative membrane protein [Saprospira grandis DSM 2844]